MPHHEIQKIQIRKAKTEDVPEIGRLYDELCDRLKEGTNYPGWLKGVYPTESDAIDGVNEDAMYVAVENEKILGTIILRHKPEDGYVNAKWPTESNYEKILVIYTLAVHPDAFKQGIGKKLMDFAEKKARAEECTSIRLDVVKGNVPAENLYKKCGYKYVDTVSLGYEEYGLPWYNLYEKML